jgi:hypothetical protein
MIRNFCSLKKAARRARWATLVVFFTISIGQMTWAASSIARIWDEEILSAIRIDLPHPPVHARNLFTFSAAMYDVWAAYDPVATGYIYRQKHTAADVSGARREAISYAAYRILKERYALSRNAAKTLIALDARMAILGYDTNNISVDTATAAGVGNAVAKAVSSFFISDGARQLAGYKDVLLGQGGYAPFNPPLISTSDGVVLWNVNRWQPLAITDAQSQNGIPVESLQRFLGSQWRNVQPFALTRTNASGPWIDPGPPPYLGGLGDAEYRKEVVQMVLLSSQLTPDDGQRIDISPASRGNNTVGTNDGTGRPLNPMTGLPYATNLVKRGDFARVLAEFWADGPNSETPPGHWNTLANAVSDHPGFIKRVENSGPVVDDLEWDVKTYFAMNAALHDAACAAWTLKRVYDGGRPISAIRMMAQRGQSSEPESPSYHPNGIPLVAGLIELVTEETAKPGGRHAGMFPGFIAIHAWPGQPANATNQYSGVRWIYASSWLPYQKKTFVTPSFPGYISGHSTFSRSAAEVLTAITGSPFFPGGIGSFTAHAYTFTTEKGPSTDVNLEWATYFDAADEAGISRLWGGIHVSADDLAGRKVGAQCGKGAWALARQYFTGSIK